MTPRSDSRACQCKAGSSAGRKRCPCTTALLDHQKLNHPPVPITAACHACTAAVPEVSKAQHLCIRKHHEHLHGGQLRHQPARIVRLPLRVLLALLLLLQLAGEGLPSCWLLPAVPADCRCAGRSAVGSVRLQVVQLRARGDHPSSLQQHRGSLGRCRGRAARLLALLQCHLRCCRPCCLPCGTNNVRSGGASTASPLAQRLRHCQPVCCQLVDSRQQELDLRHHQQQQKSS